MLDIEYGVAMSVGVKRSVFWYTPGRMPNSTEPDNEPYEAWLSDLSKAENPPSLFSISYGDNENTVQLDYGTRVNTEFMKAGTRGISILASSGDGGVGGSQPSACTKFIPTFPAGSPYITAIGGTTGSNPERTASLSGGGFSNYWDRPDYQKAAVTQYMKVAKNLPPSDRYNQTGAGFPDIAAQAEGFIIIIDGFSTGVSGTSCSSPTVAGIVALLNDVRYAAGKPALGWLNPLLYAHPEGFNDVTTGSNPGCGTQGFQAAAGWDPATGLGTPNFQKLADIVKQLP
jgi:tripeptidyl-peptidase-1